MSKRFPVLLDYYTSKDLAASETVCLSSVPWGFMIQFERTARQFHNQSLERLAERGGLSPNEIVVIITNSHDWIRVPVRTAVDFLKQRVAEYEGKSDAELVRLRRIEETARTYAEHVAARTARSRRGVQAFNALFEALEVGKDDGEQP